MSDETKPVKADEPPTKAQADERRTYPWMGADSKEFAAMSPRHLPPMLRKAHAKHVKANKGGRK